MVASILLFVGIGSHVLARTIAHWLQDAQAPDRTLAIALLLNIALILIVWRRHDDLNRQVTTLTAAEARAHQLAVRDPLTGLFNRRGLSEDGARLAREAVRRGKSIALLMIDLDHFKSINDRHGHAVGDALLRQVAAAIAGELPAGAVVARFGGDEFACAMLFDAGQPHVIDAVAERLVSRLAQPFVAEGLHLHLSASVGLSRTDADAQTLDTLLRAADTALYAAKEAGRNRSRWFDRSMEQRLAARDAIEIRLREAVPAGEIEPVFTPQVDLPTGEVVSFEVEPRWRDAVLEDVDPAVFMAVAVQGGLIHQLSLSVLRQALIAGRNWDPAIGLSANLSPAELRDPWLAQRIIKLLTETGFAPTRLEVEITETALIESMAVTQSILGSLKNQGVGIVLDAFGTGYSSLAHLRALPFDRLKIDASFVSTLGESAESVAVVTAVARLGESLNLPVTAVGVPTTSAAVRLQALGCRRGQGPAFGEPMTAAQVRQHLAGKRQLTGGAKATGRRRAS